MKITRISQSVVKVPGSIKRAHQSIIKVAGKVSTARIVYEGPDDYEGPTTVIPTADQQVLGTKDLVVREDITVEPIPYYETSNDYGVTVIIGG